MLQSNIFRCGDIDQENPMNGNVGVRQYILQVPTVRNSFRVGVASGLLPKDLLPGSTLGSVVYGS